MMITIDVMIIDERNFRSLFFPTKNKTRKKKEEEKNFFPHEIDASTKMDGEGCIDEKHTSAKKQRLNEKQLISN